MSSPLREMFGEARDLAGATERNVELYASWQLNTWTFVSPHLQVVRNDERKLGRFSPRSLLYSGNSGCW